MVGWAQGGVPTTMVLHQPWSVLELLFSGSDLCRPHTIIVDVESRMVKVEGKMK